MTMKMRACPSWNTSSTAVTATTAPNAMNVASRSSPALLQRHHQRIAACPARAAGTMPVITAAVATYSTVQTISEPMMPRGRLRWGSRVSSAAVLTASKPM